MHIIISFEAGLDDWIETTGRASSLCHVHGHFHIHVRGHIHGHLSSSIAVVCI